MFLDVQHQFCGE